MILKDIRRLRDPNFGEEPDARFSFANERTFLAWNRTALGCVVAFLAVSYVLKPEGGSTLGPRIAGVTLIATGALLAFASFGNWAKAQAALRLRQPLPASRLPMLVGTVIALVAMTALIYTLQ